MKRNKRTYIGIKFDEVAQMPDLISIQTDSYKRFLQEDKLQTEEGPDPNYGLESVFRSVFPIQSENGNFVLSYHGYRLDFSQENVHLDEKECKKRGQTYSVPIKVLLSLDNKTDNTRLEKEVYLGDIPLMTKRGSFIINGAERVVVSQIHRSPGVIAQMENGVYSSRIIPSRGSWLEFEIDDKHEGLYTKIDRKKKFLVTVFLRAIGLAKREDIVKVFYASKTIETESLKSQNQSVNSCFSYKDYFNKKEQKIIRAGDRINSMDVDALIQAGHNEIEIIDFDNPDGLAFDTIIQCFDSEEALIKRDLNEDEPSQTTVFREVLQAIQHSEMVGTDKAREEICDMFFSPKHYDFSEVGIYKFNSKFYPGKDNPRANKGSTLRLEDIIETIKYLINVSHGKESVDDIDHLGYRRVRCVGELLENQLKSGLAKFERSIIDKLQTMESDKIRIQELVSSNMLSSSIKDFFQSSQLSQFMDQINPLSELTHKRRITALGPGGLNRERAGFEVRDVHYSHYGRMCPIETPEGQNIGLIVSLAIYTKITEHGFLETPYRMVVNGKATKEIRYLDAIEEEHYYIAQAPTDIDEDGNFADEEISVRKKGEYSKQKPKDIDFMDISPRQVISVAASLIPFLEHDDANRALMGSNMQRQAVPLVFPEAPRVGTGMEWKTAYDSGILVKAKRKGVVSYVSATTIKVKPSASKDGEEDVYTLDKNIRTNQDTCFSQRPIVSVGEKVDEGDVIADGPATDNGELALGRNILVAFMPWEGYNYEDAVLISERVVKEDIFSSIHISEFSVDARETKFGTEIFTREMLSMNPSDLANLDEDGIVKIGSFVGPDDILVGKVTPKSDTDVQPDQKLLNAIFGTKSQDYKNTPLRVPHGTSGTVIRVERLGRADNEITSGGVEETVKVQIANMRKLRPGDKMAGRHGNKGVVSRILPVEDMPYTADGTPIDVCLNPLGVPSRMNIGQLMETELGWAAVKLNEWYNTPVFQSASMEQIEEKMKEAGLPVTSKQILYDGRTGEKIVNDVFCGYIYYLKLNHLVDDKVHARSTGPYSMITQQPLGGRAQFGGQRFGEMEVWALEAYGAVNTLQEILTIKSDDMVGRVRAYQSIVKGEPINSAGTPEAFSVLLQEIRGLCLDMQVFDSNGKPIPLTDRDEELIKGSVSK